MAFVDSINFRRESCLIFQSYTTIIGPIYWSSLGKKKLFFFWNIIFQTFIWASYYSDQKCCCLMGHQQEEKKSFYIDFWETIDPTIRWLFYSNKFLYIPVIESIIPSNLRFLWNLKNVNLSNISFIKLAILF